MKGLLFILISTLATQALAKPIIITRDSNLDSQNPALDVRPITNDSAADTGHAELDVRPITNDSAADTGHAELDVRPIVRETSPTVWRVLESQTLLLAFTNEKTLVVTATTAVAAGALYNLSRLFLQRANVAAAFVPPEFWQLLFQQNHNQYLISAHPVFSVEDVKAFAAMSYDQQLEVLKDNPELADYLAIVVKELAYQNFMKEYLKGKTA